MHLPNYGGLDITEESEVATVPDAPTKNHSEPSNPAAAKRSELITALWLDRTFMRELHRIAGASLGQKPSNLPTRELVDDVLVDFLSGDVIPAADGSTDLRAAVRREVRRRATAIRDDHRTIYLDDAPPAARLDRSDDPEPRDERLNEELLPAILEMAKDNLPVRRLLDIYELHVLLADTVPCRRDVLRLGMTTWAYDRARARLLEYAEAAVAARREAASNAQLGRSEP